MSTDCVVISGSSRDNIDSSIFYFFVVSSECGQSILSYLFELCISILSSLLILHVEHKNLLFLIGSDVVAFISYLLTFSFHL